MNRVAVTSLLAAASLLQALPARAAKYPNPLTTDARVKQVMFDPNQVYEVVGTYGYQTSIEFAGDETVKVVTLGDSIAWQTVPYQNRLFIKPVEPNAATNLTVVTDKRTYYFKLNSAQTKGGQTYLVRFVYPKALQVESPEGATAKSGKGIDPSKTNLDYSTSGESAAIQLRRVFDDGQFTYFQFAKNSEIPMIYAVGADGTESVINVRREDGYLVAERTAGRFTLRNGAAFLCVQNNAAKARTNGGNLGGRPW